MLYDIYFHDDFDGRASAAVMLDFLRSRGDDVGHYTPVDFSIQNEWVKERFFQTHRLFSGKRNPVIVLDFLYHPKAVFWFDHHSTAFRKEDWKKKFRQSKFQKWKPNYFSCCHLVMDALKKEGGYSPSVRIEELARWLDVIDAARYDSAKQTIEKKESALQLEIYTEDPRVAKRDIWFINALIEQSLRSITNDSMIKKCIQKYQQEVRAGLAYYKRNSKIYGVIGVITLPKNKFKLLRYAPFYLWPNLLYAVRITRKNGSFILSFGVNPWHHQEKNIHIGNFLKKHFPGAGGHKNVGGGTFNSKKEAECAALEIVKKFNA